MLGYGYRKEKPDKVMIKRKHQTYTLAPETTAYIKACAAADGVSAGKYLDYIVQQHKILRSAGVRVETDEPVVAPVAESSELATA